MEIKCPRCGYGGGFEHGTRPISSPMMCSKCKMYFNYDWSDIKTDDMDEGVLKVLEELAKH